MVDGIYEMFILTLCLCTEGDAVLTTVTIIAHGASSPVVTCRPRSQTWLVVSGMAVSPAFLIIVFPTSFVGSGTTVSA